MAGVSKKTGITDFICVSATTIPGRGHLTAGLIAATSSWFRLQMTSDWASIGVGYSGERTKQQMGPDQKGNHHRAKFRRFNGTLPIPYVSGTTVSDSDIKALFQAGFGIFHDLIAIATTVASVTSPTLIGFTDDTGIEYGMPIKIGTTNTYIISQHISGSYNLGLPVADAAELMAVVGNSYWEPQRPETQLDYFGVALSSSGDVYILEHFQPAIALKEFAENQLYDFDIKIAGGYWCRPADIGLDEQDLLDLLDTVPFSEAALVAGAEFCTIAIDGTVIENAVDTSFMVSRDIQTLEGNASCDGFIALNNNMNLAISGKISFFDEFTGELTRYTDNERFTVYLEGPAVSILAEDVFYKNPELAGDKNGSHIETYEVEYNGTMGKSPKVIFN